MLVRSPETGTIHDVRKVQEELEDPPRARVRTECGAENHRDQGDLFHQVETLESVDEDDLCRAPDCFGDGLPPYLEDVLDEE